MLTSANMLGVQGEPRLRVQDPRPLQRDGLHPAGGHRGQQAQGHHAQGAHTEHTGFVKLIDVYSMFLYFMNCFSYFKKIYIFIFSKYPAMSPKSFPL